MTAEEFKQLLADTGKAKNISVSEDVYYRYDEVLPLRGDIEIINCKIPLLSISEKELDSLTITKGQLKKLRFETGTRIKKVKFKNCINNEFYMDETHIDELAFFPAEQNRPTITSGSTSTIVISMLLEGNFKEVYFTDVGINTLHLKKVIVNKMECKLLPNMPQIIMENVKVNNMRIHDGFTDEVLIIKAPDGIKYFTNIPDF